MLLAISLASKICLTGTHNQKIRCPNQGCNNVIERIQSLSIDSKEQREAKQSQLLSAEALLHKNNFRFRCRECQTEFCAGKKYLFLALAGSYRCFPSHFFLGCNSVPYHLGLSCEQVFLSAQMLIIIITLI